MGLTSHGLTLQSLLIEKSLVSFYLCRGFSSDCGMPHTLVKCRLIIELCPLLALWRGFLGGKEIGFYFCPP